MLKFKIFNSEFLSNVSYQMIGTGLAQVLPFAISPLLTRLYSEQDFALFTSFFALASILVVGVGGRYQLAIVLPAKNNEAVKVFSLSIYITLAYSIFLLLIAFLTGIFLNHYLGNYIYLVPLYVLFFGIWSSFSYLSVRRKTFFHNASAKVLQSVVYIIVCVTLGLMKFTSIGLILGRTFGTLSSWLYLQRISIKKIRFAKIEDLKEVGLKYIDYPKFGLIPAFLDIASVQGIVLILTQFYSTSDLGYFGLTTLVLSAPIALVGGSFKDVFYQKMVSLVSSRFYSEARRFFIKSALGLLGLGIPICLVIYFFGPEIFKFVFGEKWERSGYFASLLSVSFLIQLVVSPLSSIFNATNKLRSSSFWQTLYFISTFSTLGICSYVLKIGVEDLLIVYVIHEVVLYSVYFILQYWTLKRLS